MFASRNPFMCFPWVDENPASIRLHPFRLKVCFATLCCGMKFSSLANPFFANRHPGTRDQNMGTVMPGTSSRSTTYTVCKKLW